MRLKKLFVLITSLVLVLSASSVYADQKKLLLYQLIQIPNLSLIKKMASSKVMTLMLLRPFLKTPNATK